LSKRKQFLNLLEKDLIRPHHHLPTDEENIDEVE